MLQLPVVPLLEDPVGFDEPDVPDDEESEDEESEDEAELLRVEVCLPDSLWVDVSSELSEALLLVLTWAGAGENVPTLGLQLPELLPVRWPVFALVERNEDEEDVVRLFVSP